MIIQIQRVNYLLKCLKGIKKSLKIGHIHFWKKKMTIELDIIKYNGQWVLLVNDYDI